MTERHDPDESAIETLRISRVESRSVLDHRIALLEEIDDKSLRTVRSSIVVLALLVSAGQIAGSSWVRSLHWLGATALVLAGVFFSFAIVVGMAIYSVSIVPYGVGSAHRSEALIGGYTEREWLELLLGEYDEWTTELRVLTENNARWLMYVQGAFVGGVSLVVFAVSVSLAGIPVRRGALVVVGVAAVALMVIKRVGASEER